MCTVLWRLPLSDIDKAKLRMGVQALMKSGRDKARSVLQVFGGFAPNLEELLLLARWHLEWINQHDSRHIHWHLAPLPPGVPYHQQQTAALDLKGEILTLPDDKMASLARSICQMMERLNPSSALPLSN